MCRFPEMRKEPEMKMKIPDLAAAFAIAAFLLAVLVNEGYVNECTN